MILIIDDDKAVRSSLNLLFKQSGFTALTAKDPEEARDQIRRQAFRLIVLDMNFSVATSGEEGLLLLKEIRQKYPATPVILITAWGSITLAVEGMKAGAVDFISKPWNNERFMQSVRTSLDLAERTESDSITHNRAQLDKLYDFSNIIGRAPNFVAVLNTAGRISATDASVLITGESGTGKELLAEAIHLNSNRKNGPFVKVNLGGIPASLFESEMFGHKRGAFTDAKNDRIGRFEKSDGGTIFLDEIGELDLGNQVKLLRILQDRSYEMLGTSKTIFADFRLICATNRDLAEEVSKGRFREDLYYRINLITLKIPPLRARVKDIPLLINYFIDNLKTIYQREKLSIEVQALNWLKEIAWPGNIRQLKNLVERTVLVSDQDTLNIDCFKNQLHSISSSPKEHSLPAVGTCTIDEMEKSMIEKALEFHSGNLSKTARSLGLSRTALYRRLEKYGISE